MSCHFPHPPWGPISCVLLWAPLRVFILLFWPYRIAEVRRPFRDLSLGCATLGGAIITKAWRTGGSKWHDRVDVYPMLSLTTNPSLSMYTGSCYHPFSSMLQVPLNCETMQRCFPFLQWGSSQNNHIKTHLSYGSDCYVTLSSRNH